MSKLEFLPPVEPNFDDPAEFELDSQEDGGGTYWRERRAGVDSSHYFKHAAAIMTRDIIGNYGVRQSAGGNPLPDFEAIREGPFYTRLDAQDRVEMLVKLRDRYLEHYSSVPQVSPARVSLQRAVVGIAMMHQLDTESDAQKKSGIINMDLIMRSMLETRRLEAFIENCVDNDHFDIGTASRDGGLVDFLKDWFISASLATSSRYASYWSAVTVNGLAVESAFGRSMHNHLYGYKLAKAGIRRDAYGSTDFVATDPATKSKIYIQTKSDAKASDLSLDQFRRHGKPIIIVKIPTGFVSDELRLPPKVVNTLGSEILNFKYDDPDQKSQQQ